jgi:nitrite reductase/ring-hydroxylating ferredoxin subunit
MATKHEICPVSEIPPGDREIVEVDGLSIGIFNIDGEYHALHNVCPHQLAPLCEGDVSGLVTAERTDRDSFSWECDGCIIKCPWHNWEFDITTGNSVFNPHKVKTRTYDVAVESPTQQSDEDTEDGTDDDDCHCDEETAEYGTALRGDEPPIDTYDIEVEDEFIVLYV